MRATKKKKDREHGVSVEKARELGVEIPQPPTNGERFLSPNEIGMILNVTGEAVKQWIYHRRLPAIKLANWYWKVKVTDFERFLQTRTSFRKHVFVEGSAEVKKGITDLGFHLVEAANMADAILKLVNQPPVLIVLDLNSATFPAFSLLERMATVKALKRIPVFAIGTIPEKDLDKAIRFGIKGISSDTTTALVELKKLLA